MGRVALVTGGSRGIGEAISKALKAEGYEVAATYAGNDEKAAAFTKETGIKTYKWNVADYEASAAGIAKVEADLGPIEVVVANAGITRDGAFHLMAPEQWKDGIYTTKAADLGTLKSMAQEGARAGITANAVCPGYIATEMVMAVPEKVRESIIAQIPAGRLGEPEEIARCVVFLASDDAGFINGSTISANGAQFFV